MHTLINTPFALQLIILLLPAMAAFLAGLHFTRRRFDEHRRAALNEVAGVNFAVLGGIYGVVLAFVMVGTWERFQEARYVTESEAHSVADLSRYTVAVGLVDTANDCRTYLELVINEEWKTMDYSRFSVNAQALLQKIRLAVLAFRPSDGREQAILEAMISELTQMSDARLDRLSMIPDAMPMPMWFFLIPIGSVVVIYSYLFGLENGAAHMFMTGALALAIFFSLIITFNLQFPFSGTLKVNADAYERALGGM